MYLKYVEKHFLYLLAKILLADNIIDKYVSTFKILFKCLKSLLKNKFSKNNYSHYKQCSTVDL